ncbi:hypothetical protein V6N13_063643 [Hibiscus sabdariffa]
MNRPNPRNPIYELDPEIERTRRELRQRGRELMAHRGNNDQNPIEEQDPPRQNPSASADGITSFRQEDDEAMQEAWDRYRDLFRRCPMHGLPEWTQVSIFYNSVNTPTRMMIDVSTNGTLLDKPPRQGLEILEKLAQNDYQHPTTRRGNMR